jgi:hypothetical protein
MNAPAKLPELVTESYLIPSGDAGIELYMRNKRPVGMTNFPADRILLYVHGATYPSETAFDLPIEGASMMDLIAARGSSRRRLRCAILALRSIMSASGAASTGST